MFGLLLLHLRLRGEGRGGHTWTGLDWKDYWFSSSDLQTQCNFKIFFKEKKIYIFLEILCVVFVIGEGGGGVPRHVVTQDTTTSNPGLYGGSARRPPLPPSAMDTLSSP